MGMNYVVNITEFLVLLSIGDVSAVYSMPLPDPDKVSDEEIIGALKSLSDNGFVRIPDEGTGILLLPPFDEICRVMGSAGSVFLVSFPESNMPSRVLFPAGKRSFVVIERDLTNVQDSVRIQLTDLIGYAEDLAKNEVESLLPKTRAGLQGQDGNRITGLTRTSEEKKQEELKAPGAEQGPCYSRVAVRIEEVRQDADTARPSVTGTGVTKENRTKDKEINTLTVEVTAEGSRILVEQKDNVLGQPYTRKNFVLAFLKVMGGDRT